MTNGEQLKELLDTVSEKVRKETIREIIDNVDDMVGGKMIAQALREIYLEVEE